MKHTLVVSSVPCVVELGSAPVGGSGLSRVCFPQLLELTRLSDL